MGQEQETYIPDIQDDTFSDSLKSPGLVLVYFYIPLVKTCLLMDPVIEVVAGDTKYKDKIKLYKLNAREHPKAVAAYNILSIPTLLVFKDEQVVATLPGTSRLKELRVDIERHL
ncbi:MAG: thioredoxin family protein [Bacteroidota bacterium]